MDSIDKALLTELIKNGRQTASELSKTISLSIPAVTERIRKLEQNNLIQKYTIKINKQELGFKLLAFIFVNIDNTENTQAFRKIITQYPCVLECHHVAGNYDYLLKVVVSDTSALEDFIASKLKKIKGISSSSTIICLSTLKEELSPLLSK